MSMDIRGKNLSLIESINQRGGRMLSLAGMIDAGTLNLEIAGLLIFLLSKNSSFLSCALKGGAGKTALMGALLQHLGEDTGIVPYSSLMDPPGKACVMAQEINNAHYAGYVYGPDAGRFLSLPEKHKNISVCSTAHADSPEELYDLLQNGHGIGRDLIAGLDFLVFINFFSGKRRLSSLYQSSKNGFDQIYKYVPGADGWELENGFDFSRYSIGTSESREILDNNRSLLAALVEAGAYDIYSADRLIRSI